MSRVTAAGETLCEISEVNAVKYSIPCAVDPIADRKALLDAIVANFQAERIIAASLDANTFTVYLQSLEDVSSLLRLKNVKFQDMSLLVSHAVNAFTLCNVPPSFTREDLQKVLLLYGHVVHVEALPFCSGVPQYDHIVGSERRVFLKLLPDMVNVDLPEKLMVHFQDNGIEKIVVYKHCVICKKDGHNYDSCSKIDDFHSHTVFPESSGIGINIAFEVAKEEADASTGKDVLEQVDKLLDHNYISRQDDNNKGDNNNNDDDNDSVISLPSDAFEYVNNVVTLNVRPKDEVVNERRVSVSERDTSFSEDEEKKETELENSGSSSSSMSSSSDSQTSDSSSENMNKKKNTRILRKRPRTSMRSSRKKKKSSKKSKYNVSSDSEATSPD